jgi:hypothetical protein
LSREWSVVAGRTGGVSPRSRLAGWLVVLEECEKMLCYIGAISSELLAKGGLRQVNNGQNVHLIAEIRR